MFLLELNNISADLELECVAVSSFCRQLRMPELEDCDDVVADLLMVILSQNRGSLHVHGLSCYSASSV